MKKMILLASVTVLLFASCADSKTFKKADGTEFIANPYGWMNQDKAIEGVEYKISEKNIVLSIVLGETIAVPLILTGFELWEPVFYNEPKQREQ